MTECMCCAGCQQAAHVCTPAQGAAWPVCGLLGGTAGDGLPRLWAHVRLLDLCQTAERLPPVSLSVTSHQSVPAMMRSWGPCSSSLYDVMVVQ